MEYKIINLTLINLRLVTHLKGKMFEKYEKIEKKKHAKYNALPENKLQTQSMEEINRVGSRTISIEKEYYYYFNCIWFCTSGKIES